MILTFSNATNNSKVFNLEDDIFFVVYYYGVFFILSLINIPGNMLVIVTILKHRRLRCPNNYFLVSLATSDLIVGFIYPIYNISHVDVAWIRDPLGKWPVCMFTVLGALICMMSSCFHLVAVTVTRYIAIVFPLRKNTLLTSNCSIMSLVLLWAAAAAVTFSIYSIVEPDHYNGLCRYELIYSQTQIYLFSIIQFVGPLITMIGLYAKIISTVKKKAKIRIHETNRQIRERLGIYHQSDNDNRPLLMVAVLLGWFTLSYLPMCVYFLVVALCADCHVNKYARATIRILMNTNYMINVFIYSWRMADFRGYVKRDLRKLCYCIAKKDHITAQLESTR